MAPKFITVNGVRKLNPAYRRPAQAIYPVASNHATALPVVPSAPPDDEGDIVIVMTPAYKQAVAKYQESVEAEIVVVGEEEDALTALNRVLAKYEVPAGLLSKLLEFSRFTAADVIVDDSSSMMAMTDAKGPNNSSMTRWWEAKDRISQMVELMAYVQAPAMYIHFLNRRDVLELRRNSQTESPKQFIARAEGILQAAFNRSPSGSTPALQAIQASLARYPSGQAVLRYFLGVGVPNGGPYTCGQIEQALIRRVDPASNPFTFLSCTNDDAATEWMKECEERAPYCAEFDDFLDESREVLKDQGAAFPYSFGLHVVGQLVAAFSPDDLDAMDESVPFTRHTLEGLLGYASSPEEYRYYFDHFLQAQRKLRLNAHQRTFVNQLPANYELFESTKLAKEIPAVASYRARQKQRQQQQAARNYQGQQGAMDQCCVLM